MWIPKQKNKMSEQEKQKSMNLLIRWSPLSAIFVLGLLPMYDFLGFIKLRVRAGMFRECAGVCGCVQVCVGVQ